MAAPFPIENHKIRITASIGISIFPEDSTDSAELFQQADSAMYAAKRNGRNEMLFYSTEMGSAVRDRMNLETHLREAIGRGEITVHFQPEFDVASNRLVRFEALARWQHPTLGAIPPAKFIPLAEECGIIVSLGAYILERACKEAVTWQANAPYPIQVAVNVSAVQFNRDTYVEEVIAALNRSGLSPNLLQLELTESVMLNSHIRAAATMKRLRDLGVSFVIDDFGTGYSCLSYLAKLPFHALKIDRSFISEHSRRPDTRAIVNSLVRLARSFGMGVIFEGVEKSEQLALIKELGGDEVQGYLLGRPTEDPASHLPLLEENENTRSLCVLR
jgi:predicted signal transduction protein with EAL and GGDEF domain